MEVYLHSVLRQIKPEYSVGPPSAHQRYTIQMSVRLRADDDQLLDIYWDLYALGATYSLSVPVQICVTVYAYWSLWVLRLVLTVTV